MELDAYDNGEFDRGARKVKELIWVVVSGLFFSTWLPGSLWRVTLLRLFGAKVGVGVIIKPRVVVKFPWKLHIGDYSWVGEQVWIDNLDSVSIGSHVCISQGVYLCTGSHEWSSLSFKLITKPIEIADQVWLAAFSRISPGVVIAQGAVLSFSSIATKSLREWTIYSGQPAEAIKHRVKKE
ncbi:colanic acid biosynthesis acetyltransferase WcaF [Halomonas sp. QX-2]|jgi:putative colanic acid biosynthesis acetyltransferase WcaF|uniref:Colanic acid biosynthesis acetyltransferase WcaF n=1 Tax=Vreelandella sedimenti TaxID=2729618 RepID=A0A7Z0SPJ8_9GAMM|nr:MULTISPECIES: WcaF family extracellular polysaccharide biosynthesis acetyltransferase [Halomonas]NYT74378.1 colanic acid biosynthesis acetyltransferase WcaF [Halomonas sedimenti]|tara:strand:+ start:23020 stop:23562 length:543 start_codon:yes stop_codon:yes gene_type:complete